VEGSKFDQLVRQAGPSRRAIVGTLFAAVVATLSQPAAAGAKSKRRRHRRRRNNKRTEPGLRLLEQFADALEQETGDCDALASVANTFQQQHEAELQALLDEAAGWTEEERKERTKLNRDRVGAAVRVIQTQLASCGFRGEAPSPICEEGGTSDLPDPGEATCSGCNCGCICPLSSGECVAQGFACAGGSHAACCWLGTCIDHNCSKQCENCCHVT
jgi:hypothetical protein